MISDLAPHLVKRFVISTSAGTTALVAAVAGKKIRVIHWMLSSTGAAATTFKFQSASTDLTGAMTILHDVNGVEGTYNPDGHFETVAGEALNLTQLGTEALAGYGSYIEV